MASLVLDEATQLCIILATDVVMAVDILVIKR